MWGLILQSLVGTTVVYCFFVGTPVTVPQATARWHHAPNFFSFLKWWKVEMLVPFVLLSVEPPLEQRWPVSSGADFNPTGEKPKVGFAARWDYCHNCHNTLIKSFFDVKNYLETKNKLENLRSLILENFKEGKMNQNVGWEWRRLMNNLK